MKEKQGGVAVSVSVTIAVMKHHDPKQAGEEWVCFAYTSISELIIEGSQGRTGRWRQELEERCLLACSSWFAQPVVYRLQDHQLRSGTTYNSLGPPTSVTNEENALQACR